MSTSFVEYQGLGFWSFDDYLEHVLALLANRIESSPDQEWLVELRDHWRTQASGDFRGWIHPKLDEFITNDERRDRILSLLKGITSHPGLTREVKETARQFELLLQNEITTNASSPLDYMVRGPVPYIRVDD